MIVVIVITLYKETKLYFIEVGCWGSSQSCTFETDVAVFSIFGAIKGHISNGRIKDTASENIPHVYFPPQIHTASVSTRGK